MSVCRYCHASISFVLLDSGKPIPVEPIPQPDRGNVAARRQGGSLVGYVISAVKPLRDGYSRYVPHRAHCKPEKPRVRAPDRAPALW